MVDDICSFPLKELKDLDASLKLKFYLENKEYASSVGSSVIEEAIKAYNDLQAKVDDLEKEQVLHIDIIHEIYEKEIKKLQDINLKLSEQDEYMKSREDILVKTMLRLTKVGPPSRSCKGSEWASVALEDNCNIAKKCLIEFGVLCEDDSQV